MLFISPAHSEDGSQKICNITSKDIKDLASNGKSKDLQSCKKGDILVFRVDSLYRLTNAMSRVCEISSIKLVSRNATISGICLYTGKTLDVVNY